MDFWIGTAGIFVLATLQVILFGWVLGVDKGIEEAQRGAQLSLPRVFRFVVKYVSPLYLLTIFVLWSQQNLPGYVTTLSQGGVPLVTVGVILGVLALFLALVRVAGARWDARSQGH